MKFNDARLPLSRILTIGLLPSPLKKLWYRLKGYKIGKGVSFGPGSVVEISGACEIGDHTRFSAGAVVVGETARFGKRVQVRTTAIVLVPHIEMGDDVIVSESAVIRAQQPYPDSRIILGDRSHIFPYTIMDPSRPLTIGEETAVGFDSYIFTHGAYKDKLAGYPVIYGEVTIGKAVWLPCNIFIMPGVELGDDVVVGSGSVVTKSFPAGSFILGEPAKLLKTREEFITHHSDDDRMDILRNILEEFRIYVEHFGGTSSRLEGDVLHVNDEGRAREVHLNNELPADAAGPGRIHLVLGTVPTEARRELEAAGNAWFSWLDHSCTGDLDELALALKDYLNRYGIMFARP
jgi:acetyltransferase-like isoleucine patch superfamily enzyme